MTTDQHLSLERQSDIDVGYDHSFERHWGKFERIIWLVFTLLLIAGAMGIFGRGPLNQVSRKLADGSTIQYERVVRFKTPTTVSFQVPAIGGVAQVEADRRTVTQLGLEQVVPQPTRDLGSDQVGPIQFQISSAESKPVFLQLAMQPAALGAVKSKYVVNGHTTTEIEQFIVP